jgi:hypothetical protein
LLGVVVESTYNWYWLVDGLKAAGFEVKLANPVRCLDCEECGRKQPSERY